MSFLLLGVAALAFVVWLGRRPYLARRNWRYLAAGGAVAAFAAAAFSAVRGGWTLSMALVVAGLWLAASVRRPAARPGPPAEGMSLSEARAVLGVAQGASEAEIDEAYRRLMRRAHPDAGGTPGLAAQLNAARARLKREGRG